MTKYTEPKFIFFKVTKSKITSCVSELEAPYEYQKRDCSDCNCVLWPFTCLYDVLSSPIRYGYYLHKKKKYNRQVNSSNKN